MSGSARRGPRRLIALVQKAPGIAPNQRFRIEQWSPWLAREHGIEVELRPFESPGLTEVLYQPGATTRKARLAVADALRRWRGRHELVEADAVVVVREASLVGGAWLERWLSRKHVPFVYDFDDAIWTVGQSASNGLMSLARMPWKVGSICSMAGAVTVGNAYLAGFARARNSAVHMVRTSIDIDRYPLMPEPADEGRFVIVWTGSHSTLAHLETLRPALERLGALRPVTLRVICDRPPEPFQNLTLDYVPWRAASEAVDLAAGHVGIMPLPDTEFARGKCGCKALQYMAIGRPAVVSPVGMNSEIIRHGDNGFLAADEEAWVQRLLELSADRVLRRDLGARGRATVLEGFTAQRSAAAFAIAVGDALDRKGARRASGRAPRRASTRGTAA